VKVVSNEINDLQKPHNLYGLNKNFLKHYYNRLKSESSIYYERV